MTAEEAQHDPPAPLSEGVAANLPDDDDFSSFADAVPTEEDQPSALSSPGDNDRSDNEAGQSNGSALLSHKLDEEFSSFTSAASDISKVPSPPPLGAEVSQNGGGDGGGGGDPLSLPSPDSLVGTDPALVPSEGEVPAPPLSDDADFGEFGRFADASAGDKLPDATVDGARTDEKKEDLSGGSGGGDTLGAPYNVGTGPNPAATANGDAAAKEAAAAAADAGKGSGCREYANNSGDVDDDFGEFGSFGDAAPAPSVASGVQGSVVTAAEEPGTDPVVEKTEEGRSARVDGAAAPKDDFGDFGNFDSPTAAGASSPSELADCPATEPGADEPAPNQQEEVVAAEEEDAFGDFGSFDGAEGGGNATKPEPTSDAAREDELAAPPAGKDGRGGVANDDDSDHFSDFGDFEDAPSAPTPIEEQHRPTKDAKAGVSGEGEKLAEGSRGGGDDEDEDDDDFGDFRDFDELPLPAAAPPEEVLKEQTAQRAAEADDDDGGAEDDFSDFGDFDEAGDEMPASEAPTEDPVVAKARAVFQKVFGGFAVDLSNQPPVVDNAFSPETIDSLLSSLAAGETEEADASLWSKRRLESILSDLDGLHSTPPNVVSNDDVPHPYAHYAIPVGGIDWSAVEARRGGGEGLGREGRRTGGRSGNALPAVPEVLSINLPKGPESPLQLRKPTTGAVRAAAAAVVLPPVEVEVMGGGAAREAKRAEGEKKGEVDFGGFDSAAGTAKGKDKGKDSTGAAASKAGGDGDDFNADFGSFEVADEGFLPSPTVDDEGGMSAACRDFLRQIPDLSFMLKSTLSLPSGSQDP